MKRKITFLDLYFLLILRLESTPVLAKENQTNVKPFEELWNKISEIVDTIDDLQSQITGIELIPGPTGPVGPIGPVGPVGPAGSSGAFGDYQSLQINVLYTAASDGMVIAYLRKTPRGGSNTIWGDTWSSAGYIRIAMDNSDYIASITFPVQKGTEWRVSATSGTTTSVTWMPMGD